MMRANLIALLIVVAALSRESFAQAPTVTFAVNSPGSFPYLYLDTTKQQYSGVVRDFFDSLEKNGQLKTVFTDSNPTRSEQYLREGKVDILLGNPQWLKNNSPTIVSNPVISHLTYLYSLRPFSDNFSLATIPSSTICTHVNFIYTGLVDYFTNKQLERVDASNHLTMLSMLEKQRCDFAIMNNYNAIQSINSATECHLTLYQSPQPTSRVNLYFIMRPTFHQIKELLDNALTKFKASGQLKKSLESHSALPEFPHQANCQHSS